VYFAAEYDAARIALRFPNGSQVPPMTWAIGVASAKSLLGPWSTHLLHYRGRFNRVTSQRETYGGDIDPSMVRDSRTGRMYLLVLPPVQRRLHLGRNLFRRVAVSRDPLGPFLRLATGPILRSGYGWLAPGGASHPVTGPDGQQYLFYHATRGPDMSHSSENRLLMIGHFRWTGVGGYYPLGGSRLSRALTEDMTIVQDRTDREPRPARCDRGDWVPRRANG
jgi:hypothetical protein